MNNSKFINTFWLFIGAVIFLVVFIAGLILFSYLIVIGAIIGLAIYLIARIRAKFSRAKHNHQPIHSQETVGRIIEHDKT